MLGAVPGASFLHNGVIQPLLVDEVRAGLLGAVDLARLTVAFTFDAVGFDLAFGPEAKLFPGARRIGATPWSGWAAPR